MSCAVFSECSSRVYIWSLVQIMQRSVFRKDLFEHKENSRMQIVSCNLDCISANGGAEWDLKGCQLLASPSSLCVFGKGTSKETHEPKAFASCSQLNCCKGVLQGTWFVHFYFSATIAWEKAPSRHPPFQNHADQLCHCDKGPRQLMQGEMELFRFRAFSSYCLL